MPTNHLSFLVEPLNPPDEMAVAAVPMIDARPLTELIQKYERLQRFDVIGGYAGLVFEYFNVGSPLDYLRAGESVWVLGCQCGEAGCWPLECRITLDGEVVTWSRWRQPHRPERNYSDFGEFRFASEQYFDALSTLESQLVETDRAQ